MNTTDPEPTRPEAEGGQTCDVPQENPLDKALSQVLEDNDVLLETNSSAVPLIVRKGLTLAIGQDDWDQLRKTRSLNWLNENMSQDEDSAWNAVSRGELLWVRVLGLPRFPAWQFPPQRGGAGEGLAEMMADIPIWWDSADIQTFMDSPDPRLGITTSQGISPADWLRRGQSPLDVAWILKTYRVHPRTES